MSDPVTDAAGAPQPYVSRIDRRTTLAWLAAAGAATPALARAQSPNDRAEKPVLAAPPSAAPSAPPSALLGAQGYGTDPVLVSPRPAPWPRLMTAAQLQTAAELCDFILPASGAAPSATALGVPDFIDEWVSAPYPQQVADRPVVVGGLDALEADARRRFGGSLPRLAPAERLALLTPLTIRPSGGAGAGPHAFFRRFRSLVVGAYYTTPAGFRDIGYIGNVARAADPGPSPEVVAELDARLKQMGL